MKSIIDDLNEVIAGIKDIGEEASCTQSIICSELCEQIVEIKNKLAGKQDRMEVQ